MKRPRSVMKTAAWRVQPLVLLASFSETLVRITKSHESLQRSMGREALQETLIALYTTYSINHVSTTERQFCFSRRFMIVLYFSYTRAVLPSLIPYLPLWQRKLISAA